MVKIDHEKCTGCGLCAKDCISLNIEIKENKAFIKKDCFKCGHCVAVCPKAAVSVPEYEMEDVEEYDADSFCIEPEKVLHSIKFRRSIRSYQQRQVEQEVLEQLLQAGRYTATAKNTQNCCFVFVQNEQEQLKELVWKYIDEIEKEYGSQIPRELYPFVAFNRRRKADPADDYLFRNAPVVLFITTDYTIDAGLAAQNIENMAVSMGLGALYNGFLARIANANAELKQWLGIEGKEIQACMLLGYPDRIYRRTAPRRKANVIWK